MRTVTNCAPAGAVRSLAGHGSSAPKWMQLRAIEEAREPLGMKATSISIVRAMLSYMAADRVSEMADDHHIVYASNASIAERAHVSIQTVERHISKLIKLGIIKRTTAANGKRWCRRDRAGQVLLVSGLSLLPLATRHAEFTALASEYRRAQEALLMLRDECTVAMARLQDAISDSVQDLLVRARLILRRRPQQDVLQNLLDKLNECASVENRSSETCEPTNLRDGDGEIEGHKEHSPNPNSKKEDHYWNKVTQDQMEHAFPRLCSELRFARNQTQCDQLMDQLADHMKLGEAWYAMKSSHAPAIRFMVLGYILQRVEIVRSHRAYLMSILNKIDRGEMEPRTLLIPQKTRRDEWEDHKNS